MKNQNLDFTILCGHLFDLTSIASIEVKLKACTIMPKGNEKFDVKFVCILIIQAKYYNDRAIIKVPIRRTMTQKELTARFPDIVLHFRDLSKLKLNEEVEICYPHECLLTKRQKYEIMTKIQAEIKLEISELRFKNIICECLSI